MALALATIELLEVFARQDAKIERQVRLLAAAERQAAELAERIVRQAAAITAAVRRQAAAERQPPNSLKQLNARPLQSLP